MIKRIKKGEATKIITWKLDRLSRNPVDSGTIQYMLQTGELDNIITIDRAYTDVDA
jgi:DNA invertase Pin-like site-specific DNA recombinase